MSDSVNHELKHNLLLFVILIIFLQFLQEYSLLLHVNLKMRNLIFSIENALNKVLPLDVVNSHGDLNDVPGIDDELLGVGQDAQQSMVYNGEQDVIAVNFFYLFPIGVL